MPRSCRSLLFNSERSPRQGNLDARGQSENRLSSDLRRLDQFNHVVSLEDIHRTPILRKAMAIVADVVLNRENVVFSEKDVKQAVTPLLRSRRPSED